MNSTDVFNNPSNNYVNPGLAPCVGESDSYVFKFLPKKNVGIVSGSSTLMDMSLSDIEVSITEWSEKKQVLQSGEVIYVPGLTKSLQSKSLVFDIPNFNKTNQQYYMMIDLSVNYYSNFKTYYTNIEASANYGLNLDIDDAINIKVENNSIQLSCVYDPSNFKFNGNAAGYDFEISNVKLTIIDASLDITSPFITDVSTDGNRIPQIYNLFANIDLSIPAVKYPNGAMVGYLMKATYPSTAGECDKWLYMNNVVSPYYNYKPTIVDSSIYNKYLSLVDVGMNGTSTNTDIMSAGDYLNYITENNLWDKFGPLISKISTIDPNDLITKNLVGGFYVYNPHDFQVQIQYLLIN